MTLDVDECRDVLKKAFIDYGGMEAIIEGGAPENPGPDPRNPCPSSSVRGASVAGVGQRQWRLRMFAAENDHVCQPKIVSSWQSWI